MKTTWIRIDVSLALLVATCATGFNSFWASLPAGILVSLLTIVRWSAYHARPRTVRLFLRELGFVLALWTCAALASSCWAAGLAGEDTTRLGIALILGAAVWVASAIGLSRFANRQAAGLA